MIGQLLHGKAVLLLYGFAIAMLAVAGFVYVSSGNNDDGGSKQAGVAPTTPPLLPTRAPAPTQTPLATPTAGPTQPPDRTNCNDIRGTSYRSEAERQFFLRSCAGTPSAGGSTSQTGSQGGGGGGGGGAPAPTATPKPVLEVRYLIGASTMDAIHPDLTAGVLSDDKVALTLFIEPGRQLDNGDPLNGGAVKSILEANRNQFPQQYLLFFDIVNDSAVRIRAPGKINDSILSTLSSIGILVRTR